MKKSDERSYDAMLEEILESPDINDCSFQLESFLHQIYGGKYPNDRHQIEMLRSCLFDSIKRYGEHQRKLGGYYANHPIEVARVLAEEGAPPVTVAAGLYHDVPEEYMARLKPALFNFEIAKNRAMYGSARYGPTDEELKARVKSDFFKYESRMIQRYVDRLQAELKSLMVSRGVPDKTAVMFLKQVMSTVLLVTRLHNQTYYQAMANIAGGGMLHRMKHGQVSIDRALAVKFADRLTNSLDMSQDYKVRSKTTNYSRVRKVTESELKKVFIAGDDSEQQHLLERDFMENRSHHPAKGERGYKGSDKLYQFYKNIVLIHISRARRSKTGSFFSKSSELHMVYRKGGLEERLLEVNLTELDDIVEHLLTFHVRPRTAARILEEFEDYDKSGGLLRATKAGGPSKFDGIIERFFDTRLMGNKKALQELYRNKQGMFRAALGFRRLSELFKEDSRFRFEGIGASGLTTQKRR